MANSTFLNKIISVIKPEKKDLLDIYFYSFLNALLSLAMPLSLQSIINFVTAQRFSTSLWLLIVFTILCVFLSGIMQINQMRISEKIQQHIFVRYTYNFAHHIPKIDMSSVTQYHMPEMVNRFFDVVILQKGLNKLLLDIPIATIQIFFGLILLGFYNNLFIGFGILLIIVLVIILALTSKSGLLSSIEESDYKYRVEAWLEELARILPTFKFNQSSFLHLKKTDEELNGYVIARTKHFKVLKLQYWSLLFFKILITGGMLISGVILLVDNKLNVGQFVAAEILILLVLSSVEKFILSLDNVYDCLTSMEKLNKVLEKPIEKDGHLKFEKNENGHAIELKNLSISFDNQEPIFNKFNFKLAAGKKAVIMGDSGTGKSLMMRLFTGIYNHYEGMILIDNISIHNYKLASFHQQMGIKLNSFEIFPGSLLDNIAMGNTNILFSDISSLAIKLGFENLLQKFKNGFEEQLLLGGKFLSKFEQNQILLLRALVHNPSLVLLEQPFEGMDPITHKKVASYLTNEMKATAIFISNNQDFADNCDVIVKL